jgi:hypothetical protein
MSSVYEMEQLAVEKAGHVAEALRKLGFSEAKVMTDSDGRANRISMSLLGADWAYIYLGPPGYGKSQEGKLHIGCNLHLVDNQGKTYYARDLMLGNGFSAPSINVAASKSGMQIAQDIVRRLIPDYTKVVQAASARILEYNQYNTAKADLESRFKDRVKGISGLWSVQYNKDTVSFHGSVSPAVFDKLLGLLEAEQPVIGE